MMKKQMGKYRVMKLKWFVLFFGLMVTTAQTALSAPFQINFEGELESLTTYGFPAGPPPVGSVSGHVSGGSQGGIVSGGTQPPGEYGTIPPGVVGTIDSIFTIGDPVNGRIIVDADNISTPTVSLFEITIGSYSASGSGEAFARNDNQAGLEAPILDSVVISANTNISSYPIDEFSVDRLHFAVGTGNLSILSDSSPVGPTGIMALWNDMPNYFSGNLNYMAFGNGSGVQEIARFALTSVTPEPATLSLLGLGGLALIRRKRGKNKKCENNNNL